MLISVEDLGVAIDGVSILSGVSFDIESGSRWAVIGRNGAGKSTLLRCLARLLAATHGHVRVEGRDIRTIKAGTLAKTVAYVPQAHGRTIPYRVFDYVLMGRFAHQGLFAAPSADDHRISLNALEITDTAHLESRTMDTLSGGELQRVLLAGAVSQQARVLLLDEPTTYLDPPHQRSLQQALARIHSQSETTIITVTHDINMALGDNSHILALADGTVCYRGKTTDASADAERLLYEVFGIPFVKAESIDRGVRVFVPQGWCA